MRKNSSQWIYMITALTLASASFRIEMQAFASEARMRKEE